MEDSGSGFTVDEFGDEGLDDRAFSSILNEDPFAIVLPLTLPHYGSLRVAELIAVRNQRIRLILVSGTRAPRENLEELFDLFLPSFGDGLIGSLEQEDWVHAFERRTVTIDSAIQQILKDASCFWANRHSFSWQTLVDYQRAIAAERRSFTILFLTADPADQARLRLLKEYSEVQNELSRQSKYVFTLKQMFSSRPDELARVLLETRPHIVHFSGHGDSSGRLCFEDATGSSWPADKKAIAQIFEGAARYVKCVLLNACFSSEQAEMIGAHIEYTAGLSSAVPDDAAIALAKGFYGSLAASGKVSTALQSARSNLRLLAGGSIELVCLDRTRPFCGNAG